MNLKGNLSRRQIIVVGGVALLAATKTAAIPFEQLSPDGVDPTLSTGGRTVTFTPASDPSFKDN